MPERILVALGGNALVKPGQQGSIEEQTATLASSLGGVVELIRRGHQLVVTHGNGPQVGHILIRVEEAGDKAYTLPLDVCVAQSQGEIGYLLQQTLQNILRREGLDRAVASVVTRTIVKKDDPRMLIPTKPVGPFYSEAQAADLRARGQHVVEDASRGFRRVVPSPLPLRVVETEVIRNLMHAGIVTVAVGGGGVPVHEGNNGLLEGVEAVVDKDLASAVLAVDLKIDCILDLTGVSHAMLHFGSPQEQALDGLTIAEARKYLAEGHFLPGSMGPKVEAAIYFVERTGGRVIITLPEAALDAFDGKTGTHIRDASMESVR